MRPRHIRKPSVLGRKIPWRRMTLASVMLQSGGNLDVALSLAQTARRGMPDSPNVADTLGWIYYQKGAYRSAVDFAAGGA